MQKLFLILISLGCIVFSNAIYAQERCGFDEFMEWELKKSPELRTAIHHAKIAWSTFIQNNDASALRKMNGEEEVYEIPLVIHVMHTGEAIGTNYNPEDEQLENWIEYLNQVYAGEYPGYPAPGEGGVALPIRFVLAKRDPDCNPTNGIVRVDMSGNSAYVDNGIKSGAEDPGIDISGLTALSQWPVNSYYNLYVVNKINGADGYCSGSGCSYVAGFAYLGTTPYQSPHDGAYMLAKISKPGQTTLPHEIGHAFGLHHTFRGSDGSTCPESTGDCTIDGDEVCDTEPGISLLGSCPGPTAINSCTGDPYGVNGVQHNFMNYTQCPNHFTQGQADRMMYMLLNNRPSLINSKGAQPAPAGGLTSPIAATCTPEAQTNPGNYFIGPANVFLDSIQYYSLGFLESVSYPNNLFYVDHTTGCFNAVSTSLYVTEEYELSVTTETFPQRIKVYIDYNNDGSFNENDELVMNKLSGEEEVTINSVNIIPPSGAVLNTPLRMRVVSDYAPMAVSACGDLAYGQAEDFTVTIIERDLLAMDLLRFNAKHLSNYSAELMWEIDGNDPEIKAFELERSHNGKDFNPVAQLARNNREVVYSATDAVEAPGDYFYRLKMISASGRAAYSKIIPLTFEMSSLNSIQIFPNPVQNILTIKGKEPVSLIRVSDRSGRKLTEIKTAGTDSFEHRVDFSRFAAGIYFVEIIKAEGKTEIQKVVKP